MFFHGAGGLLPQPVARGARRRFHVYAPEWPGYGTRAGEEKLDDMLDFALHGWDVVEALGLDARPNLVGHSMGGMIAAEMACIATSGLEARADRLRPGSGSTSTRCRTSSRCCPSSSREVLFADPKMGEKLLTGGIDFSNMDALKTFMVDNARRLGTAGKILFPIPNRRLSKRLYRLRAPTLLRLGTRGQADPARLRRALQAAHPGRDSRSWSRAPATWCRTSSPTPS